MWLWLLWISKSNPLVAMWATARSTFKPIPRGRVSVVFYALGLGARQKMRTCHVRCLVVPLPRAGLAAIGGTASSIVLDSNGWQSEHFQATAAVEHIWVVHVCLQIHVDLVVSQVPNAHARPRNGQNSVLSCVVMCFRHMFFSPFALMPAGAGGSRRQRGVPVNTVEGVPSFLGWISQQQSHPFTVAAMVGVRNTIPRSTVIVSKWAKMFHP
jgi:hypothetical protein